MPSPRPGYGPWDAEELDQVIAQEIEVLRQRYALQARLDAEAKARDAPPPPDPAPDPAPEPPR